MDPAAAAAALGVDGSALASLKAGTAFFKLGAKGVTFTDKTDFEVESMFCIPGADSKSTCIMNTIVDPKGAKTLTMKVWYATDKKTFKDTESMATTLGSPDCTSTFTGDTVGGDASCSVGSSIVVSIDDEEGSKSTVDATSFLIPVTLIDTSATSTAWESDIYAKLGGFWGATQVYTGTGGTRTTTQGDSETVTGASTIGAIAAAIALIAAF